MFLERSCGVRQGRVPVVVSREDDNLLGGNTAGSEDTFDLPIFKFEAEIGDVTGYEDQVPALPCKLTHQGLEDLSLVCLAPDQLEVGPPEQAFSEKTQRRHRFRQRQMNIRNVTDSDGWLFGGGGHDLTMHPTVSPDKGTIYFEAASIIFPFPSQGKAGMGFNESYHCNLILMFRKSCKNFKIVIIVMYVH